MILHMKSVSYVSEDHASLMISVLFIYLFTGEVRKFLELWLNHTFTLTLPCCLHRPLTRGL